MFSISLRQTGKKRCGDAASYQTSVCPDEYLLLHGKCIKVSAQHIISISPIFTNIENIEKEILKLQNLKVSQEITSDTGEVIDTGKRTFAMAESECLKTMDTWPYRSQLYFTNDKYELDYIAEKIPFTSNDGAWVGLRAMSSDRVWTNRYPFH